MSEVTFEPFQKVLVRDSNQDRWLPDIFRIFDNCNTHPYYCLHSNYRQCIPYNDEIKHLLGTTDSPTPPEPEFKWGDKVEVRDKEEEDWKQAIYLDTIEADYPYRAICRNSAVWYCYKYCRHADW